MPVFRQTIFIFKYLHLYSHWVAGIYGWECYDAVCSRYGAFCLLLEQ